MVNNYLEFRCPQCGSLLCKYHDQEAPYAAEIKCQKRECNTVNIKANCVPTKLVELRCQLIDEKKSEKWNEQAMCNKLLAKIIPGTDIEVKCPRCKKLTNRLSYFPELLEESM